jgi:hypothetical protein
VATKLNKPNKPNKLDEFRRELNRAGFKLDSSYPDLTVKLRRRDGKLHTSYCSQGRSSAQAAPADEDVQLDTVSPDVCCGHCSPDFVVTRYGSSALAWAAYELVGVLQHVRAAERYSADPAKSKVAGRARKLSSDLADAAAVLNRLDAELADGPLAADLDRMVEQLTAARTALAATSVSTAQREKVLTYIADELLPERMRGRITLDATPTLVGITPHMRSTPNRIAETIEAFQVADKTPGVALLCPRYVVDYLNRFYAAGSRWQSAIMTVPVPDVDQVLIDTAVGLWNPAEDGPLIDLRTALDTARLAIA